MYQVPEFERGAVFARPHRPGLMSSRDAIGQLVACLRSNDAWKSYLGSQLCVSLGSSAWHPLAARGQRSDVM